MNSSSKKSVMKKSFPVEVANHKNTNLVIPMLSGVNPDKAHNYYPNITNYIADLDVDGNVWSFFYVKNPDYDKGHKQILMLTTAGGGYVSGRTQEQFNEKFRYVSGVVCSKCGDVIYSVYNHHYHTCSCGSCSVDGGQDGYGRVVASDLFHSVKIDIFSRKVTLIEDK